MMTGGDFEDDYEISWIYDLNPADSSQIIFSSRDYLDLLIYGGCEDVD